MHRIRSYPCVRSYKIRWRLSCGAESSYLCSLAHIHAQSLLCGRWRLPFRGHAATDGEEMEIKEVLRGLLSSKLVAPMLRAVGSSPRLSDRQRAKFYNRITKKIRPDATQVFHHAVPSGEEISVFLDGTIRRLHWTGSYETDALPLFASYARHAEIVLDIGAAEGIYSLYSAAVNPAVKVIAVEASTAEQKRLEANVNANLLLGHGRIHIRCEAWSDYEGTASFYEVPGGTSSLNSNFRRGSLPTPVNVKTGDSVLEELDLAGRVGLVKIDTESTEPAVLRGLASTIERDRPVIFCEVLKGRSEEDLQGLMDQWEYKCYWLTGDGPVARALISGDPTHRYDNWLFLPNDEAPLAPDAVRRPLSPR